MPDVRCWRSTAPGPSQKRVYPASRGCRSDPAPRLTGSHGCGAVRFQNVGGGTVFRRRRQSRRRAATRTAATVPATGAGMSNVALSDSRVISGSLPLTTSPAATCTSITGTSMKMADIGDCDLDDLVNPARRAVARWLGRRGGRVLGDALLYRRGGWAAGPRRGVEPQDEVPYGYPVTEARGGPTESPQVRVPGHGPHKNPTDETTLSGIRRHAC